MFFGTHQYKVDEKGRVPLPPKFRREMKEGVVLTKGVERCITIYSLPEWKRISESLAAKAVSSSSLRRLNRAVFSTASSASFDGQGRITLPPSLREYARIGDTAVVVGANNRVEIWNEEEWQAERQAFEEQLPQMIEEFGV